MVLFLFFAGIQTGAFASATDTIPTRDDNMGMGNPSGATTVIASMNNYLVVKSQFALSYNNSKGMANWVSWHLSTAWKGSAPRCDCFTQDATLPTPFFKASSSDYTGTGFDRGHLCPSDDRDGSDTDNAATFKMTNISPQSPILNQQTWGDLEEYCRTLIYQGNELYIIAGGYGSGGTGSLGGTTNTIASGSINVPSHYWKVILVLPVGIDDASRVTTATRVIAVDMPNSQVVNSHSWEYYRTSVDAIEAATGYDFLSNVDTAVQSVIEAGVDHEAATMIAWSAAGANGVATLSPTSANAFLDTASGFSALTRGAGAAASTGANSFRTVGFQNNGISTANTDYFQVQVKPATGYQMSLSSISAQFAGTASFCAAPGVSGQFAWSRNGISYTLIGSPFVLAATPASIAGIDVASISALQNVPDTATVYLRYYASGQTTTGGWGFFSTSISDNGLALYGTVSPNGCSGTPNAGVVSADSSAFCSGGHAHVALSGASSGTGISYQWQSSATGSSFTNITGAADTSYTSGGLSAGVFYRCITTCSNSSLSAISDTAVISITTAPSAGTITGASTVLIGASITLADAAGGGTWSASNGNATVSSTGVATGVTAGTVIISYSVANSCGTAVATRIITVTATPAGTLTLCTGSSALLSAPAPGGTWASSMPAIASVTSAGLVTGAGPGTATISYTYSGGVVETLVTVNAGPVAISGTASVCQGSATTLSNSSPAGTWASSNAAVATVTSAGIVSGVSAGTAVVSYTLSNGCYATTMVSVHALPAGIPGSVAVCTGYTTSLASSSAGTWSSSDTTIATIPAGGSVVMGISTGTATLTFTNAAGCTATTVATVSTAPSVISGAAAICAGTNTTLTSLPATGVWSSSNVACATIGSATGIATGLNAGTTTITYAAGGCRMTRTMTVNPVPGSIVGSSTVCTGSAITIGNSSGPGYWSSSNAAIATVGSVNSVYARVTGVTAGTASISYTFPTGCYRAMVVTVNASPDAGAIAASNGFVIYLLDTPSSTALTSSGVAGGTWSSSAPGVASVNATTGVVLPVAPGTATISYLVSSGACTAVATHTVSVVGDGTIAITEPGTASHLRLMPNPSKGIVYLSGSAANSHEVLIQIYNTTGQLVATEHARVNNGYINHELRVADNLVNGLYVVHVGLDDRREVLKLVLER